MEFMFGFYDLDGSDISAARKVAKGDIVIIIAYATMDFEEAKRFEPSVIFPNETDNSLT